MAENSAEKDDKTEEATPERRENFREQGQVAVSRELSQVLTLAVLMLFLTAFMTRGIQELLVFFRQILQSAGSLRVDEKNITAILGNFWWKFLYIVMPMFFVVGIAGVASTFLQTQFNWSWEKLQFNFEKLNPLTGLKNMVGGRSYGELFKGLLKVAIIGGLGVLFFHQHQVQLPGLIFYSIADAWQYFFSETRWFYWLSLAVLLVFAAGDYLWNFLSVERQLKMSKQELKEELKQREADPFVKARLRRAARDIANRKSLAKTKGATVLITNPTHVSVAISYELGMVAPVVVAKGIDFLALRMREVARQWDIPIVENIPLARALYAGVKEGDEIPSDMYKAVSDVIRYIFKLKGVKVPGRKKTQDQPSSQQDLG